MFLLPVPTACVDTPVSDGSFPNDPALSGSSTYAIQSYIDVMLFLSVPTACVDALTSDGPLYRLWRVWLRYIGPLQWYIGTFYKSPSKIYVVDWNMRSIVPISKIEIHRLILHSVVSIINANVKLI